MERKANHIQLIPLTFINDTPIEVKINCPFNVKSVRFVSMAWTTDDTPPVSDTFYIASSIPGVPFVCFVDGITSNKSFEYVFSSPQQINGSYSFSSRTLTGGLYSWTAVTYTQNISIVLEFTQE